MFDTVLLILVAALLIQLVLQGGRLMAFGAEVLAFINDTLTPGVEAAIADIQKIRQIIEAPDPDIPAARAAIAAATERLNALKTVVDLPEPGDEPPAPPA